MGGVVDVVAAVRCSIMCTYHLTWPLKNNNSPITRVFKVLWCALKARWGPGGRRYGLPDPGAVTDGSTGGALATPLLQANGGSAGNNGSAHGIPRIQSLAWLNGAIALPGPGVCRDAAYLCIMNIKCIVNVNYIMYSVCCLNTQQHIACFAFATAPSIIHYISSPFFSQQQVQGVVQTVGLPGSRWRR